MVSQDVPPSQKLWISARCHLEGFPTEIAEDVGISIEFEYHIFIDPILCIVDIHYFVEYFEYCTLAVTGEWRRLHNEELHSLYHLPNIVRVIKSRRLRWAEHVARMEEGRSAFKIWGGLGVDGRTILEWTLKR